MTRTTSGEAPRLVGPAPMEGQGAYNQHSQRPAAGGALAVPLLEQAARAIESGPGDRPLLIADYGSSQGGNSMRPMRAAIAVLRQRFGAEWPICVTHADLPDNDFGTLFRTLYADPGSYLRDEPNVFASVVGRSFYEPIVPPAQVSLGWSAYAAMWLSRVPALIPGHYWEQRATGAVSDAFDAQAAADWRAFLALRARELRPGGRLVVVLAAIDEAGVHGGEPLHDAANDSLTDLVVRGSLDAAERSRMVIPARLRGRTELLAPFAETGSFAGLVAEHCEVFRMPEGAWKAYLADGDVQALSTQRARFFRSVFIPTLAAALDPARSPVERSAFADALEATLTRRLATELVEFPATAATLVVARQSG